jgi:hypothetical protein
VLASHPTAQVVHDELSFIVLSLSLMSFLPRLFFKMETWKDFEIDSD